MFFLQIRFKHENKNKLENVCENFILQILPQRLTVARPSKVIGPGETSGSGQILFNFIWSLYDFT